MERNIGSIDRSLRIALGLVLVAGAATGYVGVWAWVGVVLLATAAISYCPLYSLLGMFKVPRD